MVDQVKRARMPDLPRQVSICRHPDQRVEVRLRFFLLAPLLLRLFCLR